MLAIFFQIQKRLSKLYMENVYIPHKTLDFINNLNPKTTFYFPMSLKHPVVKLLKVKPGKISNWILLLFNVLISNKFDKLQV